MTFIAPASQARSFGDVIRPSSFRSVAQRASIRIHSTDEDGARRALGTDPHLPSTFRPAPSLEHLARIALG